jgi:hypothetical protein
MRFFLLLLTFILVGCKTIEVTAPITRLIPPPALNTRLSSLTIPIQINLSPYLKEVEKTLPMSFSGQDQRCEGISFSYRFFRQPIVFSFQKDVLNYSVDGKFDLKLNYCPTCHFLFDKTGTCIIPRVYMSCGIDEPMRRVKVAYKTKIDLAPTFKFNAATQLDKFEIIDPCKITFLNYDVTAEVKKQVQGELIKLENDIDKQIESIDIRSSIKEAWTELQEPIPIENYGFLYLQPSTISLGRLAFTTGKVDVDLNLGISPMVITEKHPFNKIAFPEMQAFKKTNGLDMTIDINASYDSLSAIINDALKDKEIEFKRKKIIIKNIIINGALDSVLVIAVSFEGTKKGTLFLVGKPKLDNVQQRVSIIDVGFEVETKSVLLKTAKWMFNDKIVNEIQKAATYDFHPLLENVKADVSKQLNTSLTDDVKMVGQIDAIYINSLHLSNSHLVIRTNIVGDLKLKIN